MNARNNTPSSEDAELFRQTLDGVTPLKHTGRIAPSTTPRPAIVRPPLPSHTVLDTLSDHGAGETAPAEYLGNGLSRMTLRKLKRAQFPVQDSLDLHGLDSDGARKLLLEFLREAFQRGLRCVCIIHGKGRHVESGEGILKIRTRHWLTQCPEVLAFCEAPLNHGGGGAVLVLLKSNSVVQE
ncbi:MAG TPA: Smr/MutS family protein [Gallionellaceae bacterium]